MEGSKLGGIGAALLRAEVAPGVGRSHGLCLRYLTAAV
jgi:hypothetical protein